ncbi:helix-turn-helix domain-containing protein [bacterium]|nr:helix-turn-helix domain-containing protein [FCB group bacterium]MBL7190857.1 helix-turn-helix domain-containing protein [bacterium]
MSEFGDSLRKHRELSGISLDDISRKTKINSRFLKAIENERFDILPDPYIRAFIKAYASALGIDVNETILKYEALISTGMEEFQEPQKEIAPAKSGSLQFDKHLAILRDNARYLAYAAGGIILLAALLFFICYLPSLTEKKPQAAKETPAPVKEKGFTVTAKAASNIYLMISIDSGDTLDYNLQAGESKDFLGHNKIWLLTSSAGATELILNDKTLEKIGPLSWTAHLILDEKGMSDIKTYENKNVR